MIWIKSFITLATQVFLKSNAGLGFIYNLKKSQKMIRSKPNQESNMDQREEDLLKKVLLSHDCKKKKEGFRYYKYSNNHPKLFVF